MTKPLAPIQIHTDEDGFVDELTIGDIDFLREARVVSVTLHLAAHKAATLTLNILGEFDIDIEGEVTTIQQPFETKIPIGKETA